MAYKQTDRELLLTLLRMQEETAPISLSIGYVDGERVRQGLILHEAPPAVLEKLIGEGYMCELTQNGVFVYKL